MLSNDLLATVKTSASSLSSVPNISHCYGTYPAKILHLCDLYMNILVIPKNSLISIMGYCIDVFNTF